MTQYRSTGHKVINNFQVKFNLSLGSFCFYSFFLSVIRIKFRVQVVLVSPRKECTGNIVPCGENSAGNGCGRQSSEMCFCQAGCQTGVLHTNFDGQGNSLFPAEAGEAGDGKAESVTAAVMQNNYQQNQAGSLQNQVTAGADNTCDNQRNCN